VSEYLSCAETAKLVRAALKKAFPGIKFSVRSDTYAGGASIRVRWTDGPSTKAVKDVAGAYAGGGFDGMIDMAYSVDSWLMPDGSASWASSPGTTGSKGVYEPYDHAAPAPGAKKVRFGADFVFCDKDWSVETYTAAVKKVCADYGVAEMPPINVCCGSPFIPGYNPVPDTNCDLGTLVHRELAKENYTS
jgi:Large polyvalent protein associated domain 29